MDWGDYYYDLTGSAEESGDILVNGRVGERERACVGV